MLKVELLTYTPEPERTVAAAARLCYSPRGASELQQDLTEKEIGSLLKRLREMGHTSTFEHVSFTFAIEGVSRVLTHQLVRHRIASYSQKSQRYVTENNFDFVVPPGIAHNPAALAIFEEQMASAREAYQRLAELVHQEDARYVLPNATETKIVVTMNARSLIHFFSVRSCMRAQHEIRQLSDQMIKLVKEVAPRLFDKVGPSCVTEGVCHEGKLTCGRLNRLKKDE